MMTGREKTEKYIEASLTVNSQISEAVCNLIIERFAGGLILEDEKDRSEIGIKFYIAEGTHPEFKKIIADYIKEVCGDEGFHEGDIKTKKIANIEWVQAYRDSVRPTAIDRVWIRPPWIDPSSHHEINLVIEPGMAFGTGSHESTRLCIREMLKYLKPGDTYFDLGCGSGILCVLAAKLGAANIMGADIDLIAVQNSHENCLLNKVEDRVEIVQGSTREGTTGRKYDFLTANIIKKTIMELYEEIHEAVSPGGIIVLSGLLAEDEKPIVQMLTEYDMLKYNINHDGDWIAVTVVKK